MDKFKQRKLRYLAFSVIVCLLSVSGLGLYKGIAAAAPQPAFTFDAATDTLSAKLGTVGYYFYTTDNASKKVPAANKWVRTNNGTVDVSNFTKGKTLYFANSTTPSLEDIVAVKVPATPAISKAIYKPTAETLDEKFEFQTKVNLTTTNSKGKQVTKAQVVTVPNSRIEIKVNDNSTWKAFSTAITDATLSGLQKEGATIYARIAPSTKTTIADGDGDKVYTYTDAGTTKLSFSDANGGVYDTESITRYGVSKTLKIAKRAVGPAISIDYANHCMTIKNTQSYGKSESTFTEPTVWRVPTEKSEKIYFGTTGTVTAEEYYGIKNNKTAKAAESLTTFIVVPATKAFADTGSIVTVQGGFEETATMTITNSEAVKGIAYQYAIVDLADTAKYGDLIKAGAYDYANANVKWSTVKTANTGVATVSLAWAKVKGKQVLVRKAAAGTEYSSKVVVFNAPTGKTLKMPEVNCWQKLTQADYGTGFVVNNAKIEFCANIDTPVYTAGTKKITFNVVGGKSVADCKNMVVKIGKQEYDVSSAVTSSANTKDKPNCCTVTIDLTKVAGLPESNANKLSIILPTGYAANSANLGTVAKTITVTVDNKAPIVKSKKFDVKKGNLVITLDSALALENTELKSGDTIAAKNITSSTAKVGTKNTAILTFTDATYTYSKNVATITIPYTVAVTSAEKVTVTLAGLTDVAGNSLAETSFELSNPGYEAP